MFQSVFSLFSFNNTMCLGIWTAKASCAIIICTKKEIKLCNMSDCCILENAYLCRVIKRNKFKGTRFNLKNIKERELFFEYFVVKFNHEIHSLVSCILCLFYCYNLIVDVVLVVL